LVIEGLLVVVEPTGVRSGTWPGAVVIGNPVMAERKHVTDLTVVTVDDWTASPLLGSGDPDDVRRLEDFYNRPLPSGEEQLRLL
jgi:hypothetical protein